MGDIWKEIKEHGRKKRYSNYESNKSILEEKQVKFIEKPNGHFIILDANNKPTHDFWASTGLIIERESKRRGRGIRNLLRFIGNEK